MPNPFPGMNPYLESPDFWPEVHHLLIGMIQESLVPQLVPKYRVAIEKRIYEIFAEGGGNALRARHLRCGEPVPGRGHLGADRRAVIELDHMLVQHPDATL